MSTTLRLVTGEYLGDLVRRRYQQVYDRARGKVIGGWPTAGRHSFQVIVPNELRTVRSLVRILQHVEFNCKAKFRGVHPHLKAMITRSAWTLRAKLCASVGLPRVPTGVESPFIQTILYTAHPDDLGPWLVYADWLEERGDPRAELIRLIMNKNVRLATKNGMPRLAARLLEVV